ncbi:MAG: class 1 isoprenoid biosynthesis enzyme [Candidatus Hodarchaeota archaeon]
MEKLKKFSKYGTEIKSILNLRNKFVQECIQDFQISKKDVVWSSVVAPSLIISLILSSEFEKNEKKRIYANCLVDLFHLFFALEDRIRDRQVTTKKEIGQYRNTKNVFRCTFKKILGDAYNEGLISEKMKTFFESFFDNLNRYAERVVYPKDESVKTERLIDKMVSGKISNLFTNNDIIEVHKTKFGNFFRGMGYFLFKFYNLNFENNKAYFDLFYNIGMLAQLVDDLRDLFWQDIEIEQPNIAMALIIHENWNEDGKKFISLINNKKNLNSSLIKQLKSRMYEMREGKINIYDFYRLIFPNTYKSINNMVQNFKENIEYCLKKLDIKEVKAEEIVEIYGILIAFIKALILKR